MWLLLALLFALIQNPADARAGGAMASAAALQRGGVAIGRPASPAAPKKRPRLELMAALERTTDELESKFASEIVRVYGSNRFMSWSLRFMHRMMVRQDGPQAGQFIPPAPIHHELTALIDAKLRSIEAFPVIAGMLARGMAKTTYGTEFAAIYAICECGKRNVAIICASKEEAKDRIQNIILQLEHNSELLAAYPDLTPARDFKGQTVGYTDYQIKLANGATIKAYEFGKAKIRGRKHGGARIDLIILDDPETDDLAYSELLREKYWRWFKRAVLRSRSTYAAIIWLGTPVGEDNLLMRARRSPAEDAEGMGWDGPVQAIAEMTVRPDGSVDFEPHWAAMHSPDDIRKMIEEMSPEDADQELFLKPASHKSKPFDIGWFTERQWDRADLTRGPHGLELAGRPLCRPIAWIDSAGSTETGADFTAIMVGARFADGQKRGVLLTARHGKWEIPAQVDLLSELHREYDLERIFHQKSHFETAAGQFVSAGYGDWLPLEPVPMNTSPGAKDRRIRDSAVATRNGALLYCLDGEDEQKRLVTEAKSYPGGKDDALDAHAGLLEKLFDPELGGTGDGFAEDTGGDREWTGAGL